MQKFQRRLISLAKKREITFKDAALVILAKDGLKPLSTVGFCSSPGLVKVLNEYEIPFNVRDGRIYIGTSARNSGNLHDGTSFGFPRCCSSVFLNPVAFMFARRSRNSFSSLSPYIFHVPCSEKCAETAKLAERYMSHIKNNYPVVAEKIEKMLC